MKKYLYHSIPPIVGFLLACICYLILVKSQAPLPYILYMPFMTLSLFWFFGIMLIQELTLKPVVNQNQTIHEEILDIEKNLKILLENDLKKSRQFKSVVSMTPERLEDYLALAIDEGTRIAKDDIQSKKKAAKNIMTTIIINRDSKYPNPID